MLTSSLFDWILFLTSYDDICQLLTLPSPYPWTDIWKNFNVSEADNRWKHVRGYSHTYTDNENVVNNVLCVCKMRCYSFHVNKCITLRHSYDLKITDLPSESWLQMPRYHNGTWGAVSIRKTVLPGMAIPMLKLRRPNGRLIFNMEIAIRR